MASRGAAVFGYVAILLVLVVGVAAAQPADYIKITPPPGMRWKTLNQSAVTNDIIFVDKNGDTWLRKGAAAIFTNSFVLVQLVGDSGGTDKWTDLLANMPRWLGLRPDQDWSNYAAFTTIPRWRELVTEQRIDAFQAAGLTGMALP